MTTVILGAGLCALVGVAIWGIGRAWDWWWGRQLKRTWDLDDRGDE